MPLMRSREMPPRWYGAGSAVSLRCGAMFGWSRRLISSAYVRRTCCGDPQRQCGERFPGCGWDSRSGRAGQTRTDVPRDRPESAKRSACSTGRTTGLVQHSVGRVRRASPPQEPADLRQSTTTGGAAVHDRRLGGDARHGLVRDGGTEIPPLARCSLGRVQPLGGTSRDTESCGCARGELNPHALAGTGT
jgi:hypothetical protein